MGCRRQARRCMRRSIVVTLQPSSWRRRLLRVNRVAHQRFGGRDAELADIEQRAGSRADCRDHQSVLYPKADNLCSAVSCRFCCRSRRGTGRSRPEGLSYIPGCRALPRERRLGRIGTDARDAYAAHTVGSGGGLATNLASRRRFWAMAASVNSSCAARGPRKRRRPSRRMRLR